MLISVDNYLNFLIFSRYLVGKLLLITFGYQVLHIFYPFFYCSFQNKIVNLCLTKNMGLMKQQVYNLKEFAARHHLESIFGAYAAHIHIDDLCEKDFIEMALERTLFTKLMLVNRGSIRMGILQHGVETEKSDRMLSASELLVVSPKHIVTFSDMSDDFEAEIIFVDEEIAADVVYQLSDDKLKSALDIFHMIGDIVRHQHINKVEMIQSMVNVLKLLVSELPYENVTITRDLKHKKDVYEIFLHLLYRHFRTERQIRFYADKLNVSAPYLSRMIKDISGTTVNDHIASLLYKEICNLLHQTDMSMGEISTYLNFSNQSAMTNFFKIRAGMTPLAYRNQL